MNTPLPKEVLSFLTASHRELVELLTTLCAIPAPSHNEGKRAAFCRQWLEAQGAEGVYIDAAQNVVYPVGCREGEDVVVFMAHTDTVFPDLEPMPLRVEGDRMYCPGVGDDTANLAVLLMLAKYVTVAGLTPRCGVLFVANSCEEGLGNLKGSRQLMADYGSQVRQVVSLDGYYDHLTVGAVGSARYKVTVKTAGGHSYGDFGSPSAIQQLAAMIEALYAIQAPTAAKTTYNVGLIGGGTSINTIAEEAHMLYEYRSEDRGCLARMEELFRQVVEQFSTDEVQVEVELLGQRPCGGDLNPEAMTTLTNRVAEVLEGYTGQAPTVAAGSTDCNIPLSMGIPAVCTGACLGDGAHTRGEWILLSSLELGYKIAATLVLDWFHGFQ